MGAKIQGGPIVVAVDTGGTFTDIVALGPAGVRVLKLPSTPDDPARAVLEGVRLALGEGGAAGAPREGGDVGGAAGAPRGGGQGGGGAAAFTLVHGSTVATNALLERRGSRVALVTNRGFEDVIEIGRQNRPALYALVGERPPPLVAAGDRHGIAGRLGPGGAEEEPLDAPELNDLPDRLEGAEAVAVCLLHSYADPAHERRVGEALAALGVPVTLSAELLPEYREYERTATTVVNAYVAPRMDRYLGRLEAESGAERVRIMGSGGGAVPVARARREAVHTVLSGPAGGVVGGLAAAREAGIEHAITFDMGGTSTDVSLCPGRPLHTRELLIAGLPVAVPVLDIHTVGAGGGSVAWVDAGGALRVGPRSAGAEPGPICYGRGGAEVTVTDAHVWLGRLPRDAFLGGRRTLDRDAVAGPLGDLAQRLGLTPEAAAEGVIAIANTAMEGALRVISVERGHDPADFALVPFGGAAGLHAVELAERLGIPRILLPPDPGVLSAVGMLASPVRKDAARTILLTDAAGDAPAIESAFAALDDEALSAMESEGVPREDVRLARMVDARYRGQSWELRVDADAWAEAFHESHRARYGYRREGAVVEAVTLRVEASGPTPALPRRTLAAADGPEAPAAGRGDVVHGARTVSAARIRREELLAGHRLRGPAIVTEYTATTWLPERWCAEVRPSGALLLARCTE